MSEERKPKIGKPILKVVHAEQEKVSPDETEYFTALHKIIDEIYVEAANNHNWTWSKLAVYSGLSYMTVVKLGERQTKYPRHMTIYKLAKSVGWKLMVVNEITKGKAVSKPKLVAVG